MKSEIEIRPADRADFVRFHGIAPPERWFGLAAVKGKLVLGIAGVWVAQDGTHWGFLDAVPAVRSPAKFHRTAIRFLKGLEAKEIKVLCDERFKRATAWLARLGFRETNEEMNGCKIWIKK